MSVISWSETESLCVLPVFVPMSPFESGRTSQPDPALHPHPPSETENMRNNMNIELSFITTRHTTRVYLEFLLYHVMFTIILSLQLAHGSILWHYKHRHRKKYISESDDIVQRRIILSSCNYGNSVTI